MHRLALRIRGDTPRPALEGFRDGWQACLKAAAAADAALAAGRILPAGNNFIVVIFVTRKPFLKTL